MRAALVLLLLVLGYSLASGIIYILWSRLIGWPVVNEDQEILLRLVHLLPSLACAAIAGWVGGTTNRIAKPLFPAALLALTIALMHYASYSRASRTAAEDIVAAAIESLTLVAVTFISWTVGNRRRRRGTQPAQGA
jgi:NO-binding membrane sensor protein with MHYT domain